MKIKLLIILLITSVFVYAQSTNRQYIGISIGPSFPTGDFTKTDLNDSTSGWAKTGVAINISYAYRLTHNFGIQIMGNFSSNRFDNLKYRDALEIQHSDTMFSIESTKNWSGGGLLVGPYLRFPLSEKLSWDFRALFGFYAGYSPKVTIRASTDDEALPSYYRESGSAFSYGYSFGTGFKYRLSKYYLLLFGDYLSSPLKFKNASGWDINNEPYLTSFDQNVSYVYVTIGLGYYF